MHRAVLLDLAPKFDADTALCLQLHAKFGKDLNAYPQLALAFAMVYGHTGRLPVSFGFTRRKGIRNFPTMEESFDFYLKTRAMLRYPLDKMTWPALLFVADNDTPIEERKWAFTHYQKLTLENFGKIYYDVAYDMDGRVGKHLRVEDSAYSLADILGDLQLGGGEDHPRRLHATQLRLAELRPPGIVAPGSATGTVCPASTLGAPQTIVRRSPSPTSTVQTLSRSASGCFSQVNTLPTTKPSGAGGPTVISDRRGCRSAPGSR